jgi:hypothetical protein
MASSALSFEMTLSSTRRCKMLSHNIRLTWPSGSGAGIIPSSVIGVRSPSRIALIRIGTDPPGRLTSFK